MKLLQAQALEFHWAAMEAAAQSGKYPDGSFADTVLEQSRKGWLAEQLLELLQSIIDGKMEMQLCEIKLNEL